MSYQQLTEGQRYQLSVLRAQGMSILATARAIGVHRSGNSDNKCDTHG